MISKTYQSIMLKREKMRTTEKQIFSYLWQSIRPYKWHLFLILQAPMVASCFVPVTQYATKILLDRLVENQKFLFSDLTLPIALFVFGQIIAESSWGLSNWVNARSMVFIKAGLTNRVYSYVIDHSYQFFQNSYAGMISAKIDNMQIITNKIFDNIKLNIINRLTILASTLLLFSVVSNLFFVAILMFYVLFFPTVYLLSKKLNSFSENYTYHRQKTSGLIVDSISNIFSVFMFSNQKIEKQSIKLSLDMVLFAEKKMLSYEFALQLFIGFLYLSISIGVLFLLIYLKQQGAITVGDFALVLGALFHMLEVSYSLVANVTEFVRDWGALKESFSLFNKEYETKDKLNAKQLHISKPSIQFRNVSFGYVEQDPVLSNLSLEVKAQEKIGLVGPSGAGKSTFVNLLLRYFEPSSGRILIDSQDIQSVTGESLRQNISVVPQDTILFHRSIKENIAYSKEQATEQEIILASKKAHIYDFICNLPEGFDTIVGERGVKLSGGQRQRIAIARAFLKDAPILILDEATSNLDSQSEQKIQESLESLIKGKTVIAIAHRLSTLKNMDRIIFLDQGRVAEEGTHKQLIKNVHGTYRKLWVLQNMPLAG